MAESLSCGSGVDSASPAASLPDSSQTPLKKKEDPQAKLLLLTPSLGAGLLATGLPEAASWTRTCINVYFWSRVAGTRASMCAHSQ